MASLLQQANFLCWLPIDFFICDAHQSWQLLPCPFLYITIPWFSQSSSAMTIFYCSLYRLWQCVMSADMSKPWQPATLTLRTPGVQKDSKWYEKNSIRSQQLLPLCPVFMHLQPFAWKGDWLSNNAFLVNLKQTSEAAMVLFSIHQKFPIAALMTLVFISNFQVISFDSIKFQPTMY